MRALIGQTLARHIRFPCAYAVPFSHSTRKTKLLDRERKNFDPCACSGTSAHACVEVVAL